LTIIPLLPSRMGKVTIGCLAVSTAVLLITFGQGMGLLRGGDVASHLYWAMGTLICVLAANLIAMVHAAQSDRLVRVLRRQLQEAASPPPADGLNDASRL
jgi:hypothetical protein